MGFEMTKEILRKRVGAVSRNAKKKGLDVLVLTSGANVTYLTGFMGDDSWVVAVGRRVWLITDSRYTEQAKGECPACKIIERKGGLVEEVGKIVDKYAQGGMVGLENMTPTLFFDALKKRLRKAKAKVQLAGGVVSAVRMAKDEGEVAAIRKSANVSKKALGIALSQVRVGMSESELAGAIEFEMRKLGAVPSFDTIVAFGANGSRPHHMPGRKKLRKNDTILIDYGSKINGYCSDMTRCYAVGKVKDEYARAYDAVLNAQAAAISAVAAGVRNDEVDKAARDVIKAAEFPEYGHGTGHGLGLEVHERPSVSGLSSDMLKAGQVVTIEPGIYLPGKFGIRIEDDVVVTKDGCKIITRGKKSPALEVLKTV